MSKSSEKFFATINDKHRSLSPVAIEERSANFLERFEHMWICVSTYQLDDESMKALSGGNAAKLILDSENLLALNFGCFNCETPYAPGLLGTQCTGRRIG